MIVSGLKNQRSLLLIRKDMRLGGPRTGCSVVMLKNMRLGCLCGDEEEYENMRIFGGQRNG
jgi:hypothetical protein